MNYRIRPIKALSDNYIWLIDNGYEALCIDPGQAAPVLDFLTQQQLQLSAVWITHLHHDHTDGAAELKARFSGCRVYAPEGMAGADEILAEGGEVIWQAVRARIWHTPGHTAEHISYLADLSGSLHVFCGDTLFSAGCGRAFTNRPDWLHQSLQRFNTLPADTLFYPAHEYTAANLRFAARIEPGNPAVQAALNAAENRNGQATLPVSLAHERQINPFLRLNEETVIRSVLQEYPHSGRQSENIFTALREWKNRF